MTERPSLQSQEFSISPRSSTSTFATERRVVSSRTSAESEQLAESPLPEISGASATTSTNIRPESCVTLPLTYDPTSDPVMGRLRGARSDVLCLNRRSYHRPRRQHPQMASQQGLGILSEPRPGSGAARTADSRDIAPALVRFLLYGVWNHPL